MGQHSFAWHFVFLTFQAHKEKKSQCEALDGPMVFLTFQGANSCYGTTAPTCVMIQLLQLQCYSRITESQRRALWGYLHLVMPTGLLFIDMKTLHYTTTGNKTTDNIIMKRVLFTYKDFGSTDEDMQLQ